MDHLNLTIEETLSQCSKPTGEIGFEFGKRMNNHHKPVLKWGLNLIFDDINKKNLNILDVGCGAGLAINLISEIVSDSKINGIDYSEEMVEASKLYNKHLVDSENLIIQKGSVEKLPFNNNQFDLITATETTYFWPALLENVKEVYRTLKNNGSFAVINEDFYRDENHSVQQKAMIDSTTTNFLKENEHLELFQNAGFTDIKITTHPDERWIVVQGVKKES